LGEREKRRIDRSEKETIDFFKLCFDNLISLLKDYILKLKSFFFYPEPTVSEAKGFNVNNPEEEIRIEYKCIWKGKIKPD